MLRDPLRHPDDVGFLEAVPAEKRRRDLCREGDDWRRVHHRVRQAGDEVRRARAGRREAHAGAARRAREALRGVRGALLVPHEEVPDRRAVERVVERQRGAAGVPEDVGHAEREELVGHRARGVRAGLRLGLRRSGLGGHAVLPAETVIAGLGRRDSRERPRHGPFGSRRDEARVLREDAGRRPGRGGPVRPAARGEVGLADLDVEAAGHDVERHGVAVLHERDRPAGRGLGRDVPDHEAVRRAREAAVRHERDGLAEALAHERRRHGEHLGHARRALRALVADHDDVAGLDPARLDGRERRDLAVEDARRTRVAHPLVSRELHDRALGRERAAQDREPAVRLERLRDGADDLLPRRLDGVVRLVEERPAGDRHRVLHEARLHEAPRDEARAAGAREVGRREAAARLEVHEERRPRRDRVEVVEHERHAGLPRDREEVEDGVRRAAGRGDGRDRVLERGPREDLRRRQSVLQPLHDEAAHGPGDARLRRVGGRHVVRAHRREAEERRAPSPSCSP